MSIAAGDRRSRPRQGLGFRILPAAGHRLQRSATTGATLALVAWVTLVGPLGSPRAIEDRSFAGTRTLVVNDDGGWCWFSEARTLISDDGVLHTASVATGDGRTGAIEVSRLDLRAGAGAQRAVLGETIADDHNNPGLAPTGAGGVLALWSAHGADSRLRVARAAAPDEAWRPLPDIERRRAAEPPGRGVSYSSVHHLSASDEHLVAYRGEGYTWNLLRTSDDGGSWTALGALVAPERTGDRPYLRFAADSARMWFAGVERHPNVEDGRPATSVRVGYVDRAGTVFTPAGRRLGRTGGEVGIDEVPVALASPPGAMAWIADLVVHDGAPVVAVSLRTGPSSVAPGAHGHRYVRVQQEGGDWVAEDIAEGGTQLGVPGSRISWESEPSYSGLVALDPTDPDRAVVSTNVDPLTGEELISGADGQRHFELFEMTRRGDGAPWRARALTRDSEADNIRPHIARGGGTKTLTWMRGWYANPFQYDTELVARVAR